MSEFPRAKLEATLVSGKKIVLCELTGEDELRVLDDVGDLTGLKASRFAMFASVWRSVESVDGVPVDRTQADPTALAFRKRFSSKEWRQIEEAYGELHGLSEAELRTFRNSIKLSV